MKKTPKFLYALLPVILVSAFIFYVAYRTRRVSIPRRKWKRFHQQGTISLEASHCRQLEGIYRTNQGNYFFGDRAVLKWSYVVEKEKTIHKLSFFCEKNGLYIICEGRLYDNHIMLWGYWRKGAANGSGIIHLTGKYYPKNSSFALQKSPIMLHGVYGEGEEEPLHPVSFYYQQTLPDKPALQIIGHRGGSRNVDFLPVSENSIEMLKMAASLGAAGVEIDIRLTKDGVPVVFHDSFLSIHTVKDKLYGGPLHNYTLEELKTIELRKGGFIPTLDEYLFTMLYQTPLETAWLDIKKECDLTMIQELQKEYMHKAKHAGRNFRIYIGIPDENILACFRQLDNYLQIPSLIEGDPQLAIENNAEVWATQYIKGIRQEDVAKIHAAGKKAYVWTLDKKEIIALYMNEGCFDGVVTNTPSVAAFWYYTSEIVATESTRTNTNLYSRLQNKCNKFFTVIRNAN